MMPRIIATLGGIGYLQPGGGTWGSLFALPLAWAIIALGGWVTFLAAILLAIGVGAWAIKIETARTGVRDPAEIVVDELAGQWLALLPVAYGAHYANVDVLKLYPGWIVAFVAFRFFDIRKPWLVGRADQRGTPWGVMEDDLWAGLFAAFTVIVLAVLAHMVLL